MPSPTSKPGDSKGLGKLAPAPGRQAKRTKNTTFAVLVVTCLFFTITFNVFHHFITDGAAHNASFKAAEDFLQRHMRTRIYRGDRKDDNPNKKKDEETLSELELLKEPKPPGRQRQDSVQESQLGLGGQHRLGGLSCAKYGGPSDEVAAEMVYWQDIPSDSQYVSPFKKEGEVKYMTFEPDGGGWNNIRMAMETVVALAHAMGRTLVMPAEQGMYLLGKRVNRQKHRFSFADFFHLDSLDAEHRGIDIITMEDFLEREAMSGRMIDKTTGKTSFPPGNRTKWDGGNGTEITTLKEWLREVSLVPQWRPEVCMASFPSATGPEHIKDLKDMLKLIKQKGPKDPNRDWNQFKDQPPLKVDAPAIDRMRQLVERRDLCVYDEEMQLAPYVHFVCARKLQLRLLVHSYAFLYFEDWKQDLWTKRFIRDHLRYLDELQCAAARVVNEIRERARKRDPSNNPDGLFDSMHIRRGDFQFKETRIDAPQILENSQDVLTEKATVYIATDEHDRAFFKPFAERYDTCFLDDFKHLYKDLNTNYYGMLDQLIASKGRIFVGTFFSTFTGYITRMRGYHVDKNKLKGHENGTTQSYYFMPLERKYEMTQYTPVHQPFWQREFPAAWRDIDKGIRELSAASN